MATMLYCCVVGNAMHALLLAVVNDRDAVVHKGECHRITKEHSDGNNENNGMKERHQLRLWGSTDRLAQRGTF